jgi:hypothetical protein
LTATMTINVMTKVTIKVVIQYACEVITWVAINDGKHDKDVDMRAKLDKKVAASTRYPPF